MENVLFNISDGLSQESRQFRELAEGFYAIDQSSLKDYLVTIKKVCEERKLPEVLGDVDLDELVQMVEGEAHGNVEPSAALYAACAKLLLRAKDRLNQLPDRRIDFYYEKILGEKLLGTRGDSAHVIFPKPAAGTNVNLPAGTQFLAGEDSEGLSIEFKSTKPVNINDASVERLLSMAVSDEMSATFTEIPVYSLKTVSDGDEMTPYPLFGLTRSGHRSVHARNARLGLAFASPILNLKEGTRQIRSTFIFEADSVRGTLLESGARQNAQDFLKAFSSAFKIYLTVEDGWYGVGGYQIEARVLDPKFAPNCFCLTIDLPESAPSIVGYNSEIHGDDFGAQDPVIKIELNALSSYNPWKQIRKLKLLKIQTEVKVRGLRSFEASNDIGDLSLSTPVQPFGPIPVVGNSLTVSSDEFSGKKLTSLEMNGDWRGIPNKHDFSEWYRYYPNIPRTSDFLVSVSGYGDGTQNPNLNQRPVLQNLFYTKKSRISTDFHISFNEVLAPCSKKSHYKIRLYSPEKSFMHQEYSRVLCDSLMAQAMKKVAPTAVPNSPYTPELDNLSLSYEARCEISTRRISSSKDSGEIFYLHPWGFSSRNQIGDVGGAFFIGIGYSELPKRVNLFFHLKRDSEYVISDDFGEFSWSVLCNDNWVNLPSENILYNSTAGFTTSGIVSLELPRAMSRGGKLMPGDLAWIRLRPLRGYRHCSRIYSVYAQAVEVTRCTGDSNGVLEHVKPGSITSLSESREGLSEVCQITESFGGHAPENKARMRTRVAEFLYHRGRALSPRDYERLILEEFPEVHMAKCFPGLSPEGRGKLVPGSVTIVPVSKLVKTVSSAWDPCLSGKVLNDIKDFLKEKVPASVNIHVVNPLFEKMQVRCNVDLRDGYGVGESLQDLNQKINEYISPWYGPGPEEFFGWTMYEEDLKSFILGLEYVKFVKELSILRIVSSDSQHYDVDHTACDNSGIIRGLTPWSVPTSMAKHFLNIVPEISQAKSISVGYGDLEIGSTFILRRRGDETK